MKKIIPIFALCGALGSLPVGCSKPDSSTSPSSTSAPSASSTDENAGSTKPALSNNPSESSEPRASTPSAAQSPASSPKPGGPLEFTGKWTVGKKYSNRVAMQSTSTVKVPNAPMPIQQSTEQTQVYQMSVLRENENQGKDIELEFTSHQLKSSMAGNVVMDVDTSKPSAQGQNSPMQSLLHKKIVVSTDSNGKTVSVSGVDEIISGLITPGTNQNAAMVQSLFSDDSMKQLADVNGILPNKTLSVGDSWSHSSTMGLGPLGTIQTVQNMTFTGYETVNGRNCGVLSGTGTISSVEDGTTSLQNMRLDQGEIFSTYYFDPIESMVIGSKVQQKMNMTLSMQGQQIQTLIDQTINSSLTELTE